MFSARVNTSKEQKTHHNCSTILQDEENFVRDGRPEVSTKGSYLLVPKQLTIDITLKASHDQLEASTAGAR